MRHGAASRAAAHQHDDLLRERREVHGGLTGGICSAYYVHGFTLASNRFRRAATVVDARALEALDSRDVERAPLHAHGQKQSVTGDLGTVRKFEVAVRTIDADADGFLRRKNLHIEAPRLRYSAAGEIAAT